MGLDREYRRDNELNRLLDDLARPESEKAADVPGKRTRVEQLIDQLSAQQRTGQRVSAPGRRTLVERLLSVASGLSFDDLRVRALQDVLGALGRKQKLKDATVAAADRDVAKRAMPIGRALPRQAAGAGGEAMWQVAERRAATLYRQAASAGEVTADDPAVEAALARVGSGAPLPAGVRRKMEDELGVSLERVRVHSDPLAAQAARSVRAEAFTVGEDIFFAEGAFAPDSRAGQKLLAHELAHVVQGWQGKRDSAAGGVRVSQPGESLEQEADAVAERVERGQPSHTGAGNAPRAGKASAERAQPTKATRAHGELAKPGPARRNVLAAPPPASTGARTLHRKAAEPSERRPTPKSTKPGTIQPTIKRRTQRSPPTCARPPAPRARCPISSPSPSTPPRRAWPR